MTRYTSQGATFSQDRRFRWTLWRTWESGLFPAPRQSTALWVMLNPSTADEHVLDPTIRRCEDFSRRWGYSGLVVCNLFAYRSTDPNALRFVSKKGHDIVGSEWNDLNIANQALQAAVVITAWGNDGRLNDRDQVVMAVLREAASGRLFHLGLNSDGTPKHPLYLPKETALIRWDQP